MSVGDVTDDSELLVGDVVQDRKTNKPLQIVGRDDRPAKRVRAIWDSEYNHTVFGIEEDSAVYECVYLPGADSYYLPEEMHRFPEERLERFRAEHPSDKRRLQAAIVRSALSGLISDIRQRGYDDVADAVVAQLEAHYDRDFAKSVDELAEVMDTVA